MNRLLADTLSFLNGLLALGIVLAGAAVGYGGSYAGGNKLLGLMVGGLLGFLIAGAICGLIAFLVLIEQHLRRIASAADYSADYGDRRPSGRHEPKI